MRNLLFLPFLLIAAVSAADIQLGSSLSASDPNSSWISTNNTFALKFIADPNPTSSSSSQTLIAAITYNNVPIWQAGTSVSTSSAVLRLLPSGDLQLLPSPTSTTPIWSSSTANIGVSAASLEESGNFILKNSSGAALWSTFDHPTDTIVYTQTLNSNQTLSAGLYSFHLQQNGNLTLLWNNSVTYYNSGLNSTNSNLTNPTISIISTGILSLNDSSLSSSLTLAYSSDYATEGTVFRLLKLDTDGNLRIYSSDGSGTLSPTWSAVSDQCQVYGFCGNWGICSYNNSNPICQCPSQNFELIDPNHSTKGCRRKTDLQNCTGDQTMLQLDHSVFLTYLPELSSQVYYQGTRPCRQNCLVGSSCIASTSLADGSGMCYLKSSNFISGYHNPSIPSTSFVKVCPPALPNPAVTTVTTGGRNRWRLQPWLVAVVVFATIIGLLSVEGGLWWCCFRKTDKFGVLSSHYTLLEYASGAPVQFSYKELEKATKGFKEKLGEGGFGAVYKGILANKTVAAVKQLEGIEQGEKQFRMEVATISSTHHLNLVRLIGFCSEGRHRLLVYEYMKNASLDRFLFAAASEEQSVKHLSWEYRYSIALGTARGITYLHEECRDCIVHCDIKPENILLDENYVAKVSDFGLAKLVNVKDHRYRTLTSVRGTRGYLAPEWLANLPITSKSDVYSFGMVLLEIVSGRRNFEVSLESGNKKFSIWAYEEFEKGNLEGILDKKVNNEEVNMEQVKRAIEVSFWCIQEQPSHRPMMGRVVQMLEGVVEINRPPPPREGFVGGSSVSSGGSILSPSMAAISSRDERASTSLLFESETK